ncbi:MAG TPA: penicillin-binding protein 2, partial [Paracoccaceae bacterium]|nr:penicillin-binding protein 2 [Paracoccaceae bacterium]
WEQFSLVSLNTPSLPGILPEVGLTRFYPARDNYAHLIGYVGPVSESDLSRMEEPDPLFQIPRFPIGKTGVELTFEEQLRGGAGTRRIEVNSAGRIMRELERNGGDPGADLTLTVESDLQAYTQERLVGESAAAVVLDVENGDVVASVSGPSFDPNNLVLGISSKNWNTLLNDPFRPLSNKPVSGGYPPGSTFKMVVALAAMQAGEMKPDDEVFCPGHYDLGDRRFHCWSRGGHGRVDLRKSLRESCDVYYYDIARRVGIDNIAAMARQLGLGDRLDLPLPAVSRGIIPTKAWKEERYSQSWLIGDTLNSGIGQGFVLATPMQLAVMTARIATGKAVNPRLVHAIDGVPQPREGFADLGINEEHLRAVRNGMFAVLNETRGTA